MIAQIGRAVLIFKWIDEVVRVHKLEQIQTGNQVATELATLEKQATFFAVAADGGEYVYLSGSREG